MSKITIDRAVVEQALEALYDSVPKSYEATDDYREGLWMNLRAARRALRAALEQPQAEQEPVAWIENIGGGIGYNPYHDAARKLPDGVRFDLYTHPQNLNCRSNQHRLATLWGYEKPRQTRPTKVKIDYRAECWPESPHHQPSQPHLQPLPNEQIRKLIPPWAAWKYEVGHDEAVKFARAIEAAHGIKEQE